MVYRRELPLLKTWYGLIATFFGIGSFSKMPGTLGTLAAFLILLVTGSVNAVVIAATIIVGTVASDIYAKRSASEDPSEVVIDEVAGYWISMYGLDPTFSFIAFFLFRIFDIIKPFPIRHMEKLPGGFGIMADDICCGIITNLLIRLTHWLFFTGGIGMIYQYLGIHG